MRKDKESLNLECVLTDSEVLTYSRTMAEEISRKQHMENQKASYTKQMTAEIATHEAKIAVLSEKVKNGKEWRDVECRVIYDWDNKTRAWIRNDTGEIAKTDIIPEEDLQEEMNLAH